MIRFRVLFFLQLAGTSAINGLSVTSSDGGSFPFRVFYDSSNHLHRDIKYHPEQPERITACIKALQKLQSTDDNIELIDVAPESDQQPFSEEELVHARSILLRTHQPDLVISLEERCRKAKEKRIAEGKEPLGHIGYIDFDTFLTTHTYDVCLRAMVAWIRAVNYALSSSNIPSNRNNESPRSAMALTRPPGHHATYGLQNGFCVFNYAAAAAIHTVDSSTTAADAPDGSNARPRKVSILDFDVHYGQGVADIVKSHENIRFVSIHQTPAYPYEGEKLEVVGQHQNVMTIPMPPDTTWTCGYRDLYQKALEFCCNESWHPDLVIVCAGYDALASDHLASTSLIAEDYGRMVRLLREHVGNQVAIMFGLEGGYQLADSGPSGNLPDAVLETVKAMTRKFIEQDRSISK